MRCWSHAVTSDSVSRAYCARSMWSTSWLGAKLAVSIWTLFFARIIIIDSPESPLPVVASSHRSARRPCYVPGLVARVVRSGLKMPTHKKPSFLSQCAATRLLHEPTSSIRVSQVVGTVTGSTCLWWSMMRTMFCVKSASSGTTWLWSTSTRRKRPAAWSSFNSSISSCK